METWKQVRERALREGNEELRKLAEQQLEYNKFTVKKHRDKKKAELEEAKKVKI
ncbi:MAG: hypothetical protein ACOVQA_04770 [Thermoflexibacteraceae bacterium]|jgi:hypothetical protein